MSTPASQNENGIAITCPTCGAYAQHRWGEMAFYIAGEDDAETVEDWAVGICVACESPSFWKDERLFYPSSANAPLPHADLPTSIKDDYVEARDIASRSPRAAAALLRLCIQKLCMELGKPGKNLDDDIASLVADGLDTRVQKSLDVVRVIGNSAIHPARIDAGDLVQHTSTLFRLVNEIAEEMIGKPKRLDELYESLPEAQHEHIDFRNRKALEKAVKTDS